MAAIGGWAFVRWELKQERPLLDVRALKDRVVSVGSSLGLVTYFFNFGTALFLAQYLQLVLGYSPLQTGIRLIPTAAVTTLIAPFTAPLVERFGAKRLMVVGLLLCGTGIGVLQTANETSGYLPVLVAISLQGSGVALAMITTTALVMGALPKERSGMASAIQNATRQLGAALGIALVGSLVAARYHAEVDTALAGSGAGPEARSSLGAARRAADRLPAEAGAAVRAAARHAFVEAMHLGALTCSLMAFVGAVMVACLLPRQRADADAAGAAASVASIAAQ